MVKSRDGREDAERWAMDEAEYVILHDVAAIAYVPEDDLGRFLIETIFPPDEEGLAEDHEIAAYFGFDDYGEITHQYVQDFVEGAKTVWRGVAGTKPPPGWEC